MLDASLPAALQCNAGRSLLQPSKARAGKHPAIDPGFVQVLSPSTNKPPGNVPGIFSGSVMEILAQPGRLGQLYPVKIKDSDNVGYTYKKPQTS